MFSEELMARLGELNRRLDPVVHLTVPVPPSNSTTTPLPCPDAQDEDLSSLPRGELVSNAWGTHWIRRRALSDLWPHGDHWLSQSWVRLDEARGQPTVGSAELRALLAHLPRHVLYLDLETCGFSGSMVFLIGLIHFCDGQFQLSQLLARNYAEEKAMLQSLWSIAAENHVLATFNGKSFDWPMVHDRSTLHHLGAALPATRPERQAPSETAPSAVEQLTRHDARPQLVHCDLLHHARRRWKDKLPNCKLQTLERVICRRHRNDDIPGREIPAAYHDFVRSGDAWLIRNVLHHNALDLITLLQLSMLLATKPNSTHIK
jgi:uncharacterized protein YprB with RNaseH-like and TPR domain